MLNEAGGRFFPPFLPSMNHIAEYCRLVSVRTMATFATTLILTTVIIKAFDDEDPSALAPQLQTRETCEGGKLIAAVPAASLVCVSARPPPAQVAYAGLEGIFPQMSRIKPRHSSTAPNALRIARLPPTKYATPSSYSAVPERVDHVHVLLLPRYVFTVVLRRQSLLIVPDTRWTMTRGFHSRDNFPSLRMLFIRRIQLSRPRPQKQEDSAHLVFNWGPVRSID